MIIKLLQKAGYTVSKTQSDEKRFPDIEKEFWPLYYKCKPFTMTSVERMFALYQSVRYVLANNISGDFVECGVWKGGSAMMILEVLKEANELNRKIYLYDTFEGMAEPTDKDINHKGSSARDIYKNRIDSEPWCFSPIEEVRQNVSTTQYPMGNIILIKGFVEQTIPSTIPNEISLLRLDTDWYESTYHELKHLYPIISKNGVLIIDDYGYWKGCRMATDKYFSEANIKPLLSRIDLTGRLMIKVLL